MSGTTQINSSESNGISEGNIENITKSDSNFSTGFFDHHALPEISFNGHYLRNKNIFIHKKVINIYFLNTTSVAKRFKYRMHGKRCHLFGADMSSFAHIDNKNRDILILGEGRTQGLVETTLTAEAKYPINFTQPNKKKRIKTTL